ncbi:MAG: hypothetical protein HQL66_03085 [Magnetococcales bacterium]|nr:hypothetical protein [Magnetococcales bacterium]
MPVAIRHAKNAVVMEILDDKDRESGRIWFSALEAFHGISKGRVPQTCHIDLKNVQRLCGLGTVVLLAIRDRARKMGGEVILMNLSPGARDALRSAGMREECAVPA